jgi:release factor glutamine methyltransferase
MQFDQAMSRQTSMSVSIKLRRKIRPLLFRLLWPALNHHLKKNADTKVAGLKLRTDMEVFHPKYFFSSKILGRYLAVKVLPNEKVLDMGTGSGVIGIMAAKRGAQVLAVDINPAAVALADENARLHHLTDRWCCRTSDLFVRVDPTEKFDWIAFNPPYFPQPARRPQDAAWHAGKNYETIDRFLSEAKSFLKTSGRIVMILSSDMPLDFLQDKFQHCGYHLAAHDSKPHLFEIFHLVQLQASGGL